MQASINYLKTIAVVSLSLLALEFPVYAQEAKIIYQKATPSVLALVMTDRTGQPISLGSGFVVRGDLVATNFHVIRGAASGSAKVVGSKATYTIQGVVAKDPDRDLAILKISGLTAPALTLNVKTDPAIGDSVFAIGNPQGLEGTLSQGIVSGIRTVGSSSWVQVTAPISPGSSGGPVLNQAGSVIGVAVATLRGGQNLNFAVSSRHVEELLSRVATTPESLSIASRAQPTGKETASTAIGGPAIDKVTPTNIQCTPSGYGSWHCDFSVRNGLEVGIKNVRYLAILRDRTGQPIDAHEGRIAQYSQQVRPGLALRTRNIDGQFNITDETKKLVSKIDVRILSFEPAE